MKIKGVAMWASVQSPNTKYDPVYCVDLEVTDEVAKQAKKDGLNPKKKDDKWVIKFKRKVFKKDGTENPKPKVVDSANNEFTGLIGNGSVVNVAYSLYEWSNKFGTGTGVDLQGIQVIDLVPYKGNDVDFEPVDGFVSAKPSSVAVSGSDNTDFDDDEDPFS